MAPTGYPNVVTLILGVINFPLSNEHRVYIQKREQIQITAILCVGESESEVSSYCWNSRYPLSCLAWFPRNHTPTRTADTGFPAEGKVGQIALTWPRQRPSGAVGWSVSLPAAVFSPGIAGGKLTPQEKRTNPPQRHSALPFQRKSLSKPLSPPPTPI